MENINKEKLLEEFLSNKEIVYKLLSENRKVFDYIIKWDKTWKTGIELMEEEIKDFIEETFFYDNDLNTKEELLESIEDYDLYEYIDWKIDIYDEDLLNSYTYFQEFVEKEEQASDLLEILKKAQFDWYEKFYEDIRNEFVEFLGKYFQN